MSDTNVNYLPEDPEGREKLAEEIERVVSLLNQIDVIKADIKEIAKDVEDKLVVKKSVFNKLAKSKYKEDAVKARKEAEDVEESLNILFAD